MLARTSSPGLLASPAPPSSLALAPPVPLLLAPPNVVPPAAPIPPHFAAWLRPSVTGSAPSARCAHSTVATGSRLIVFGGYASSKEGPPCLQVDSWNGTRMLNDLHMFNPDSMTWSRPITTGEPPGPRAGHTCVAFGTKLCVFGGGDGSRYLNDVFVLDTGIDCSH
jgi:hypothetical protein